MGKIKTIEHETESRSSESKDIEELLRARGIPTEVVNDRDGQSSIWILSKPLKKLQTTSTDDQTTEGDETASDEELHLRGSL